MNIQKINFGIPSQSFRGILTEPEYSDINNTYYQHGLESEVGTRQHREVRNLYPYMNESQEKINEVVQKYTRHKTFKDGLIEFIDDASVYIKETLPCTEREAKDFMSKHKITEKEFIKNIELFKLIFKR